MILLNDPLSPPFSCELNNDISSPDSPDQHVISILSFITFVRYHNMVTSSRLYYIYRYIWKTCVSPRPLTGGVS